MTTDELKTAARRRLPVTCHGRRYDRISAVRWYLDHQEWLDNVTSGDYQKYYEMQYGK
jgi:hypothetical protein